MEDPEEKTAYNRRRPQPLEPSAPVAGGIRWRSRRHELTALCRLDKGLNVYDPDDDPIAQAVAAPEPETAAGPCIVSHPPEEARVGEECVYQARALDGSTDGFTWYFEKSVSGMTVDRHTGKVTWTPAEGGHVEAVLCARSLYGKTARQVWTVCVRKPAARVPVVNRRFSEALQRKTARPACRVRAVWHRARRRIGMTGLPAAPPGGRFRVAVPLRV